MFNRFLWCVCKVFISLVGFVGFWCSLIPSVFLFIYNGRKLLDDLFDFTEIANNYIDNRFLNEYEYLEDDHKALGETNVDKTPPVRIMLTKTSTREIMI